jgi:hypothetical protein
MSSFFSSGHDEHPGEEAGVRAPLRSLRVQCRGLQQSHRGPRVLQGKFRNFSF